MVQPSTASPGTHDPLIKTFAPDVSWLMATHVANDHLRAAIQSCLSQTFTNFECIVVTNGPLADMVAKQIHEWFRHDHRLRIVTTEVRHLNFSLSLGLHIAQAPLVARMDADDISTPNRLEQQVAYMRSHPAVAVLGTQYDVINQSGDVTSNVVLPTSDQAIRSRLTNGNPFCHPSVMFKRDVVLEAGGYLGGLHAEDYDLWARLALLPSIEFANLPVTCLQYRDVGVGSARGARAAYATMAGAQFRNFVAGHGLHWATAALISWGKAMFKANRP